MLEYLKLMDGLFPHVKGRGRPSAGFSRGGLGPRLGIDTSLPMKAFERAVDGAFYLTCRGLGGLK